MPGTGGRGQSKDVNRPVRPRDWIPRPSPQAQPGFASLARSRCVPASPRRERYGRKWTRARRKLPVTSCRLPADHRPVTPRPPRTRYPQDPRPRPSPLAFLTALKASSAPQLHGLPQVGGATLPDNTGIGDDVGGTSMSVDASRAARKAAAWGRPRRRTIHSRPRTLPWR
jgi:hypothetical protein